ncbi:unnamed protein product [Heligmosomoides polygyrus]|uniref:GIY-YIG domain-containing protein n=1 Tax=Heligmosomoides polygyrus TaxID=6339 RepID=A0A183GPN4_HELPZ|nr:unnamed protein product [Heligmosomoides polygyrus]
MGMCRTTCLGKVVDRQQLEHVPLKGSLFSALYDGCTQHPSADCVRKAELDDLVWVVETPPANFKVQLVRNHLYDTACTTPSCMVCPHGREGDCRVSGTVYLITCSQCNEEYIGETSRPLWVRVRVHVDGLDECKVFTPLGKDRLRG